MQGTDNMILVKHIKTFNFFICITLLSILCGCASAPPLETKNIETKDIDTYQVTIPGITGDYDLLFLTDTHIIIPEENASDEIKDYSAERYSHFTGESGIIASDQFIAWIDYANEKQLDGVLMGGDIIDSPSSSNIEYLDSCLKKLEIPYIYTMGNHDWTYPWEYMTEKGTDEYLPRLAPYMEENTAIHTKEFQEFIVVAIDNSSNQINPAALEEYKKILALNKPVILLMHVPLYTETLLAKASEIWPGSVVLGGGIHGGFYPNEVSTEFIQLTTAKDSPVAAIIAGHVHFADESDVIGEKNIPQITGDAGYKGKGSLIHITGSEKK